MPQVGISTTPSFVNCLHSKMKAKGTKTNCRGFALRMCFVYGSGVADHVGLCSQRLQFPHQPHNYKSTPTPPTLTDRTRDVDMSVTTASFRKLETTNIPVYRIKAERTPSPWQNFSFYNEKHSRIFDKTFQDILNIPGCPREHPRTPRALFEILAEPSHSRSTLYDIPREFSQVLEVFFFFSYPFK